MVPSLESLGIDKMTTAERYELIEAIEESLEYEEFEPPPISDEFRVFLLRRRDEALADPEGGISREELRIRLKHVIEHGL